MKKKSLLTVMAVTTAFSGVVAVSQPSDAEAASSAKTQVTKAEKLAQKLATEINYDKRKKLHPKTPVGLPNAKLYKDTKAAYNKALAAVKKAKASERKVLQARLSQKVKPTIDRTAKYISAVNTGNKLLAESKAVEKNVKAYKLDSKTKKSYEALSADYKKLDKQINSVYGSSTRISLKKAYTYKIAPTYKKARFAFSFKSNTDNLAKAIKEGNYTKAKSYKNSVDKLIADNKKYKYANVTTTLYKKLIAAYSPLSSQVSKMITTYTATSKDASNPTLFGGTATNPVTINQDVVIVAGEGKYIKLQNVVVNGNVIIKGDATGAGTVTLDNVKVNGTKTIGGQIIVDDVAEHSLYLNNVHANDVVVNDANGSNIVAQNGTQVGNLIVSEKAGAKGTVTLNSAAPNAFGTVTVSNKGNEGSNGIVIKGDYSNTKIIVAGEGQKVTVAKDAKIKELELQSSDNLTVEEDATVTTITIAAESKGEVITLSGELKNVIVIIKNDNAKIIIPAGTVVGEIKKDASVTGTVNIDNKGTIEKAEEGITVEGNKPVEVVPVTPVTPPVGGGGGGGTPTLDILNITGEVTDGNFTFDKTNNTATLTGTPTSQLSSLTFEGNLDGYNLELVSLDGFSVNKSFTEPTTDANNSITISPNAFLPTQLQNRFSLNDLKSVLGEEATIVLKLTKDGAIESTKTITLDLAVNQNDWFELRRASVNNIEVVLKKPTSPLTDMYNYNQIDETTFVTPLLLAYSISADNAEISFNESNEYSTISSANIKSGLDITDASLVGDLIDQTIKVDVNDDDVADHTITFVLN